MSIILHKVEKAYEYPVEIGFMEPIDMIKSFYDSYHVRIRHPLPHLRRLLDDACH